MSEHSGKPNHYKRSYSQKLETEANIFDKYFDKTKISNKKTIYWKNNSKVFMGRKRNLWNENNNLLKEKDKLLDENDDLFYRNNQLKNENDDLFYENNQLQNDVDKANEKSSRRKKKYKILKEDYKDLCGKNKNLRKENENLIKENNYMRGLLSYFGIWLNENDKQIKNNTENQQMCNPFMSKLMGFDYSTNSKLFNNINMLTAERKQNSAPKTSFLPLEK